MQSNPVVLVSCYFIIKTDLGPLSWKILMLRVAPRNKSLRNVGFLLKLKILVKKEVIQKAS